MEKTSVRYLRGFGPKRSEALKRLGIETVHELCYFFPRRYEDRSQFQSIAGLAPGTEATIRAEILNSGVRMMKRLSIFELIVGDETGATTVVWFNQSYLQSQFQKGEKLILSGKIERYQDRLQMVSPEYELIQTGEEDTIHTARITPIYPLTEGLSQRSLRAAMKMVMDQHVPQELKEFLPDPLREHFNLMSLIEAVRTMHFPDSFSVLEEARRRIIFDEFFLFELNLLSKLRAIQRKEQSIPFQNGAELFEKFKQALPFRLTEEQIVAIQEILAQVSRNVPMHQLLQGEVGSGKTAVAAFFLFLAAQNNVQSVLLVPTEILAEQHFQTLTSLFRTLNVSTALLTGSLDEVEKQAVYSSLSSGTISIAIGTHALLQEEVQFKQLGLVVIDEQHRFGVRQRAKLILRSPRPHLLVMTATPIPRTLGLTLYGDLNISTIRSLPEGRRPVKTFWVARRLEQEILERIRKRITEQNEQAYILFPLIEETEGSDLQAAVQEYERLKKGVFNGIPIGLLHGRVPKKERDETMQKFRRGEIKILVATSIIEVGVDCPNVTCMIIEHSERFGLSQLHQMRGRIGRGEKESFCFLFGEPETEEGKKRLQILTRTNDGFAIAEEDLKLRGPGEFFGTKQSGLPAFQVADLVRDVSILIAARKEAGKILDLDPNLHQPEHQSLAVELEQRKEVLRRS